ncbi:hypothetical protein Emed_000993 [Eimeria media]
MEKETLGVTLTKETGSPVSSPRNFTGKGRAEYADGSSYEGDFVAGKKEGVGVYVHPNGDTYQGPYKQGKRHGVGKLKFAAGGFFHGSFVEGRREGLGCRQFANGDIYYGEWRGGKYHASSSSSNRRTHLCSNKAAGVPVLGDAADRVRTSNSKCSNNCSSSSSSTLATLVMCGLSNSAVGKAPPRLLGFNQSVGIGRRGWGPSADSGLEPLHACEGTAAAAAAAAAAADPFDLQLSMP